MTYLQIEQAWTLRRIRGGGEADEMNPSDQQRHVWTFLRGTATAKAQLLMGIQALVYTSIIRSGCVCCFEPIEQKVCLFTEVFLNSGPVGIVILGGQVG
jgi:hypothetical protein